MVTHAKSCASNFLIAVFSVKGLLAPNVVGSWSSSLNAASVTGSLAMGGGRAVLSWAARRAEAKWPGHVLPAPCRPFPSQEAHPKADSEAEILGSMAPCEKTLKALELTH
mmetsp:Transcript_36569/g.78013  ORF Transcript_36569/g.78013 Transcript_36569/m.78013 type:complete len:110 (-) Transcript_36569:169-498(-)|eukprot:CAMPEP_0183348858 /NCGR_PEP_ID=MMETSP0164_2-20130417/13235_1 /TAXON_ID=221442 /ORGANISM="Coccolithus pelagicus ssp braarudi, Strain PLY182g" /LENGTH=109 /DNA_ID=CAMNT_0025520509 /DNA_START=411 /DNA_END=740 /DNA_ORIENTATION=-